VIAQVELQLPYEEWLDLDYRLLRILHDRWLTLRWQDQWQTGALIAANYNNGFRSYKTPLKAEDFVFTLPPGQKVRRRVGAERKKRMTKARATAIFDVFRKAAEGFENHAG
jgi:hypothetical protein